MNFKIDDNYKNKIWYLKAIGIIGVVFGHYSNGFAPFLKLGYFHMPLFFFIGGILIKDISSSKNLIIEIFNKSKSIIGYTIITYIIIGLWGIIIGKILNIPGRFGLPFQANLLDTVTFSFTENYHNNKLFLVAWFLRAYLFSLILANIIIFIIANVIRNKRTLNIILIITAILLIHCANYYAGLYKVTNQYFYNIYAQTLIASNYMLIGYALKKYIFRITNWLFALSCLILAIYLISYFNTSALILAWSKFSILSIFISYLMLYVIFTFADCLNGLGEIKSLKVIGQYSRAIMSYHLICYIVADLLIIRFSDFDITKIITLRHFYYNNDLSSDVLTPIYVGSGVLLPVFIGLLIQKLAFIIRNFKYNFYNG